MNRSRTVAEARLTLAFREIDHDALPSVGGKAANLGEMVRAKLPAPEGFPQASPRRGFVGSRSCPARSRPSREEGV